MPPLNILHLWSLNSPHNDDLSLDNLESAQAHSIASALFLTQALAQQKISTAKLWLVTQNAQPIQTTPDCMQTPLWGLGRVAALEHPEFWGGLIDLDATTSPSTNAQHVWLEITETDDEDQVAWRGQQRLVARLERAEIPEAAPLTLAEEGTYLLTGGLGGLGLNIARWLAEHGAKHLVLTSRSGLPDRETWASVINDEMRRRITAVQEIEGIGATVHIAQADVANQADMAALFAQFGESLPPLRGVLHTAVAMTSWPLATMPAEGLNAMLRSKVTGSWLLHELTKSLELDFFVLFSSTTALWGVNGLGHYAAANQFMDSLAYERQAAGLPAISINWGTWEEMRVASEDDEQQFAEFGLKPMPMAQALAVLGNLLTVKDKPQVAVANVEWQTLKSAYEAKRPKPFLANVADRKPTPKKAITKTEAVPQLQEQVAGRSAEERQRIVMTRVKEAVAEVLGIEANRLNDTQQGLFDMGMDSLMSVELKSHLETAVGQTLPSTLTFNYPTIDDLSEYLNTEILAEVDVADTPEVEDVDEITAVLSEADAEEETDLDSDDLSEDDLAALLLQKLDQLD